MFEYSSILSDMDLSKCKSSSILVWKIEPVVGALQRR
jgi:hypothetical protein